MGTLVSWEAGEGSPTSARPVSATSGTSFAGLGASDAGLEVHREVIVME